jgi:hypothetical protein
MASYVANLIQPGSTSDSPVRKVMLTRAAGNEITIPQNTLAPGAFLYPSPHTFPGQYAAVSTTFSDSVTRVINHARLPVEMTVTIDTVGRKYEGRQATIENASTVDVTIAAQGFKSRLITEISIPSQITGRHLGAYRAQAQALTLVQNSVVHHQARRSTLEGLIASEVVSLRHGNNRSFAETHVTTAALLKGVMHLRSATETHSISTAASHHANTHRALREAYLTSDRPGRRYGALRARGEMLDATQSAVAKLNHARYLNQSLTLSDTVSQSFHHPNSYVRANSQILTTTDAVGQLAHHNHLQLLSEHLTATEVVSVRMLLPVEGYVNYNSITGETTFDLPDWGYVLVEAPEGNSLYWAPLPQFEFDPYREK